MFKGGSRYTLVSHPLQSSSREPVMQLGTVSTHIVVWAAGQRLGSTYDISCTEIMLHAIYGVSLPIRGVMYCAVEWSNPDYKAER